MDGTPQEVFSRADELREIGLDLPDSMAITTALKKAGMDIDIDCLTMDEAAEQIAQQDQGKVREKQLGVVHGGEAYSYPDGCLGCARQLAWRKG